MVEFTKTSFPIIAKEFYIKTLSFLSKPAEKNIANRKKSITKLQITPSWYNETD